MLATRCVLVSCLGVALGVGLASHARAEPSQALPRSLRDGAPRRKLPTPTHARPSTEAAASPAPAPSLSLDSRDRAGRAGDAKRGAELLRREIDLLRRLVARTEPGNPSRAAALWRLSQAYQELIWALRVELDEVNRRRGDGCGCDDSPTAYARR